MMKTLPRRLLNRTTNFYESRFCLRVEYWPSDTGFVPPFGMSSSSLAAIGQPSSRISGLCMEWRGRECAAALLAKMEIAREEPIVCAGFDTPVCARLALASVRPMCHLNDSSHR